MIRARPAPAAGTALQTGQQKAAPGARERLMRAPKGGPDLR